MTQDVELLRLYVQKGSEEAFSELVRRHLPLVYATALRHLSGDEELARDVAQTVFIDLARKARDLTQRDLLAGWLYTSTRFAALKAVRSAQRRRVREREAVLMQTADRVPEREPDLRDLLDEAISELGSEERNALVLRYFESKELKAVGVALGISEDAARMRVNRALGKLHTILTGKGFTLSVAALATVLSAEALVAVPAALAASITAAALANAVSAGSGTGLLKLAFSGEGRTGLLVLALLLLSVSLLYFKYAGRRSPPAQASVPQLVTESPAEVATESNPLPKFRAASGSTPSSNSEPGVDAVVPRIERRPDTQDMLAFPPGAGAAGLDLAWIAPEKFVMGSPDSEAGRRENEGPQTEVTLTAGFWLGRYEVTVAQYRQVSAKPAPQNGLFRLLNGRDPTLYPVAGVSWEDATNFCERLTCREREARRLPEGYVYRLPTEAEWEYACRAGSTNRFSFGDDPGYRALPSKAWFSANSGGSTHKIGSLPANPWGLRDMEGNLAEWCFDRLRTYPGRARTNMLGSVLTDFHVLRGGAWNAAPEACRSAFRHSCMSSERIIEAGFRVALARPINVVKGSTPSEGTADTNNSSLSAGTVPLVLELPPPAYKGLPLDFPLTSYMEPFPTKPRPPFRVPEGVSNLAPAALLTCSDAASAANLAAMTDGRKGASDAVFLRKGAQWVQMDLGSPKELFGIVIWHAHNSAKVFHSVVVRLADDPDFSENVRTLFNNDYLNNLGFGEAHQLEYFETHEGKLIDCKGARGRFVRFYSRGSTESALNEYTEIEVYGRAWGAVDGAGEGQ